MGPSLPTYLLMKTHPSIQNPQHKWSRILVIGSHSRDPNKVLLAENEKKDKPFNWQRPTVSVVDDGETLVLHVFPGVDYVRHYANIVKTYLALEGDGGEVVVRYVEPSKEECLKPLEESNLGKMGVVDVVLVGYVHRLGRWTEEGSWEDGDEDDQLFAWKIITHKGLRIAFLGCRICFWGDIGGNLVRVLQELNSPKCILYIGKLGSLRAEHEPNQWLATGCQSLVHDHLVTWKNPLERHIHHFPNVAQGVHYSLGSVLDETKEWLLATEKGYDFVDPEIGHMAKAAGEGGTEFGFLHIVSDNLARKYVHDLSNERRMEVVRDRRVLLDGVEDILEGFFEEWAER